MGAPPPRVGVAGIEAHSCQEGEKESKAAFHRKQHFLFVQLSKCAPSGQCPGSQSRQFPVSARPEACWWRLGHVCTLRRGAGWCCVAAILPSQATASGGCPCDGLSTAVSPWKCPPAWSPWGIPKPRCPPMAELCSTFCNQTGWSQRFLISSR